MFVLSKEPKKEELQAHLNEECKLGRDIVTVRTYSTNTQSGSYEKGLKFHSTTYVMLVKNASKMFPELSFDYGKTWTVNRAGALKTAGRSKIMLKRTTSKEFAYDAIQEINRRYGM